MASPNAAAYKQSNSFLASTFIPYYSTVSYAPAYAGATATASPNFGSGYGSTNWRNGIEIGGTANGSSNQAIYYSIYSDTYTQGATSSANSLPAVWGVTAGQTTTDILNLVNKLPAMYPITKHTTYAQATEWLITRGYFLANRNYPAIMYNHLTSPMILAFDPSFSASYPLTGSSLYELTGNSATGGSLTGSATWDSTNKNSILLTGGSITLPAPLLNNYTFEINNQSSLTVSAWFYMTSNPTTNNIGTIFSLTDPQSGASVRGGSLPNTFGSWMCLFIDSSGDLYFEGDPQKSSSPTITAPTKITGSAISAGSWHNVTIVMDFQTPGNNITVSIDGVNPTTYSYNWVQGGIVNGSPTGVGLLGCAAFDYNGGQLPGSTLNGRLGAFYMYSGSLNTGQMKDIYPKCLPVYP